MSRRVQSMRWGGDTEQGRLCIASIVNAFGGSGISGAEHSLALARRGHRVTMLTYAENTLPRVAHANLEVRAVEAPFWGGIPYPDAALSFASAIQRIADERPVDVIHAHYAVTHGQAALLARDAIVHDARLSGQSPGPAVVITCRGTDVTRFATDPRTAPALRFILNRADGLTFLSEGLRARAIHHLQLRRQSRVIPNFLPAIDPPGQPRPHPFPRSFSGSVVFFHVSNFREVKNVCWLVRAFAVAMARHDARSGRITLLLVGDGPTRDAAETLAGDLGIADHAAFIGAVPAEDVRDIVRRADVLLMASEAEGCPRAVLEAMAEAKPVIATNVVGLNEMVTDGVTGRLCPLGCIDAYAAAISQLAVDAQLRQRMGLTGRGEAERRYNCDAVMSAYEDVYAQAVARVSLHNERP